MKVLWGGDNEAEAHVAVALAVRRGADPKKVKIERVGRRLRVIEE